MKTSLLLLGLVLTLQISAQTTTRQDGLLYRLYDSVEETPFAEVFGCVLEDNASVTIPDSILKDNILYPVTHIADYAFNNCKEIVAVSIGKNIKSISEGAFNECSNLQSVHMSDSIHSIGGYAFNRCGKLEKIVFSKSLDYILFSAFSYSGLTELTLPHTLKIVADDAFQYCHNLRCIIIQGELESKLRFNNDVFKGCENISEIYYNSPKLCGAYKNLFDSNIYKTATLIVFSGCLQSAYDIEPWLYFVHIKENDSAAINDIRIDDVTECDIEIFNFNGAKISGNINDLAPGLYIIRQGNVTKKIITR